MVISARLSEQWKIFNPHRSNCCWSARLLKLRMWKSNSVRHETVWSADRRTIRLCASARVKRDWYDVEIFQSAQPRVRMFIGGARNS
jgi:hypothetical protein